MRGGAMDMQKYECAYVYSPRMESAPDDSVLPLHLDRSAARTDGPAPASHAAVRYSGREPAPGLAVVRRVFLKAGAVTGATDWYVVPDEADDEARVEARKNRIPFDETVWQHGAIM